MLFKTEYFPPLSWAKLHDTKVRTLYFDIFFFYAPPFLILLLLAFNAFNKGAYPSFLSYLIFASWMAVLIFFNLKTIYQKRKFVKSEKLSKYKNLANFYRSIRVKALEDYMTVFRAKKKSKIEKPLNLFEIESIKEFLIEENQGRELSTIYGKYDKENDRIKPVITQKMLDLNDLLLKTNSKTPENDTNLLEFLRGILIISIYLQRSFEYLDNKQNIINNAKSGTKNEIVKKRLNRNFQKILNLLSADIKALYKSKKDFKLKDSANDSLSLIDISYMQYDVTDNGKIVNYYRLPEHDAELYLQFKAQREAPLRHTQEIDEKLKNLTAGHLSTIAASLDTPDSQVATTTDSKNFAFLKVLEKVGMATEIPISTDLQPNNKNNVTSFQINEKSKETVRKLIHSRLN